MSSIKITVVMPCLDEEGFIRQAVESLVDDWFQENGELIIVDGMSEDGTRKVIESMMKEGIPVRLLNNEHRIQAHGLNIGIEASRGEIIIRADAHCVYPPEYIQKCMEMLEETGAANVGGMMLPVGKEESQQVVALALRHPVGVGDAKWHLGNYRGFVDTVYLGTFRKVLFEEIGLYDTECRTNEDAELNLRILKAGKKIYMDGGIQVIYYPRETLDRLARQYFRYGRGRAYTTLKHRRLTSWRQAAPVALLAGLGGAIVLGIWQPWFWTLPVVYLGSLVLVSFLSWRGKKGEGLGKIPFRQRIKLVGAWVAMHVAWGLGFVWETINRLRLEKERED